MKKYFIIVQSDITMAEIISSLRLGSRLLGFDNNIEFNGIILNLIQQMLLTEGRVRNED